jgi:hypothetical protein
MVWFLMAAGLAAAGGCFCYGRRRKGEGARACRRIALVALVMALVFALALAGGAAGGPIP